MYVYHSRDRFGFDRHPGDGATMHFLIDLPIRLFNSPESRFPNRLVSEMLIFIYREIRESR